MVKSENGMGFGAGVELAASAWAELLFEAMFSLLKVDRIINLFAIFSILLLYTDLKTKRKLNT